MCEDCIANIGVSFD